MLNKHQKYIKESIVFSVVIALGIILDQITKSLAVKYLKNAPEIPIIQGVFHLGYTENRGAAFGMFSDSRWVFMLFSTVMILLLAIYLYYPKKEAKLLFLTGTALVISGGIGNMIDRIALEYVVDFLSFVLIDFPLFNVADSLVCVGAGIMVLSLLLDVIKEVKEGKK